MLSREVISIYYAVWSIQVLIQVIDLKQQNQMCTYVSLTIAVAVTSFIIYSVRSLSTFIHNWKRSFIKHVQLFPSI